MRILITMGFQIALVPLYLNYWSVETYGVWLAIQALVAIMTMLDMGHQTFLGYEFLRFGRRKQNVLSKYLWSGVLIGSGIGALQILLILVLVFTGTLAHLLDNTNTLNADVIDAAGKVLIMQGAVWLISSSVGGLFVRVLEPFGYYPRMAWWGVYLALTVNLAPAIAVAFGADLLVTGIVAACGTIAFNIPEYIDMFYLMRKEKIKYTTPSLKLGYRNFLRSAAIAGKLLLENARQQGVRIVLAPLSGAAGLAAFSTMRTGANAALQGLNTITNPLMPDLMRFLHDRDQMRSESAFSTVWAVVVVLMAPAVVILQALVEPLFSLWTNGQIPFDPKLFAMLSLGVLVYAVVQPAMAVVLGNNLIKEQLLLSILAAVTVVGGMFILVPTIGILGAGIALFAAEVVAGIGYAYFAIRWLRQNSLVWPRQTFFTAIISVVTAGATMFAMISLPQIKWIILAGGIGLSLWNIWRYWLILPVIVTQRAIHIVTHLPGVKRFFTS